MTHDWVSHRSPRRKGQLYAASRQYSLYWKVAPHERRHLSEQRTAAYAAGDDLGRVQPGDTLWFINVHQGELLLLGRLVVEIVVDDTELAMQLVDSPLPWHEADSYAIANRYQVEPLREVSITHLLPELRFGAENQALDLGKGLVQQLMHLRALSASSARLLEDMWFGQLYVPQTSEDFLEFSEDDRAYHEGQMVTRTLRERQRSKALVQAAKERQLREQGRWVCEVCGFDFLATYGVEYIEAHHLTAMASINERTTHTPDDLALLCANCHRAIHSQTPPLSIDELRRRLRQK